MCSCGTTYSRNTQCINRLDKYLPGKAQVLEQKGRPSNFKVLPALLYFYLKPLHKIVYLSTAYTLAAQNPSILLCVISSG